MKEGVLVGADRNQEWLLPWWWQRYSRWNDRPVAFADFGLSTKAKSWCAKRGQLIALPLFFAKEREEVASEKAVLWEAKYGDNFWTSRSGWFNKPFACLASPFDRTVWADLDCEVLGSLQKLFALLEGDKEVFLAKDAFAESFNSGVIAFKKRALLIADWAAHSERENGQFRGDQDLLSHLIAAKGFSVGELPPIYNWPVGCGENPEAVICHWIGELSKKALAQEIRC